jgi:hypothetical protein
MSVPRPRRSSGALAAADSSFARTLNGNDAPPPGTSRRLLLSFRWHARGPQTPAEPAFALQDRLRRPSGANPARSVAYRLVLETSSELLTGYLCDSTLYNNEARYNETL